VAGYLDRQISLIRLIEIKIWRFPVPCESPNEPNSLEQRAIRLKTHNISIGRLLGRERYQSSSSASAGGQGRPAEAPLAEDVLPYSAHGLGMGKVEEDNT